LPEIGEKATTPVVENIGGFRSFSDRLDPYWFDQEDSSASWGSVESFEFVHYDQQCMLTQSLKR